jgi:hypothetical protein
MKTIQFEVLRAIVYPLWWAYTFPERFRSWKEYFRFRRAVWLRGGSKTPDYKLVAIVAAYYRHTQSLDRLIDTLNEHGADVFLVFNREPDSSELELWGPKCVAILRRANFGWDWGAYKEGLDYVHRLRTYEGRPLIIANDSVYYVSRPHQLLAALIDHSADVSAQLINKEAGYHAQSWLIRFSSVVTSDGSVRQFFRRYRPSFGKARTIKKGEKKLTWFLRKRGYSFGSVYNGPSLIPVLRDNPSLIWAPELLSLGAGIATDMSAWAKWSSLRRETVGAVMRERLGQLMETKNAAGVLPLTLTRSFGAPLKLDLLKWPRSPHSSASISDALEGFVEPEDKQILDDWFSASLSWASFSGIQRLFFNLGLR